MTAKTVASSLAQLLESMTLSDLTQPIQANFSANTFNICNNVFMPTQQYDKTSINEIFQTTLIRGLVNGNSLAGGKMVHRAIILLIAIPLC